MHSCRGGTAASAPRRHPRQCRRRRCFHIPLSACHLYPSSCEHATRLPPPCSLSFPSTSPHRTSITALRSRPVPDAVTHCHTNDIKQLCSSELPPWRPVNELSPTTRADAAPAPMQSDSPRTARVTAKPPPKPPPGRYPTLSTTVGLRSHTCARSDSPPPPTPPRACLPRCRPRPPSATSAAARLRHSPPLQSVPRPLATPTCRQKLPPLPRHTSRRPPRRSPAPPPPPASQILPLPPPSAPRLPTCCSTMLPHSHSNSPQCTPAWLHL